MCRSGRVDDHVDDDARPVCVCVSGYKMAENNEKASVKWNVGRAVHTHTYTNCVKQMPGRAFQ